MCLISSYFHGLLPIIKSPYQELSKLSYFQYFVNFLLMQFNVIHLIYIVKCFPLNVIILITTKNHMNCILYFFDSHNFSKFYISSWKLYHLVTFVARLWDSSAVLAKRSYFWSYWILDTFLSKEFFCLWKRSYSFSFYKPKEGFTNSSP